MKLGRRSPRRRIFSRELDYITPAIKAINRFFDTTNIQALCTPCHKVKTMRESSTQQTKAVRDWRVFARSEI